MKNKFTEKQVASIYDLTLLIREIVPQLAKETDPYKIDRDLKFFSYLIDDLEYMVINQAEDPIDGKI